MAEFAEIAKQASRLCKYYQKDKSCARCTLSSENIRRKSSLCMTITDIDAHDAIEIERIVTEWAKEHQEPMYPSWKDAWYSLFPGADEPCPEQWFCEECPEGMECSECIERPMSKKVADKLGIKPITTAKAVPAHDGCEGCRWMDKHGYEEPCKNCCGVMGGSTPDLWEER